MNTLRVSNWYGKGKAPVQSEKERMLLAGYKKRLEERRLSGAPPKFDPKIGPYAELYRQEVPAIAKLISRGDVVVDVGAGRGRLVEAALEQGASKVFALEPDARAFNELANRFSGRSVCTVYGKAQSMIAFDDNEVDLALFVGNNLGMMWDVSRDWETMVCYQKEAILEMIRVARREVAFVVYGKETIESAIETYLECRDNVIGICDGLVLVEERVDSRKPYRIASGSGGSHERFVYQKFDRAYLGHLLQEAGLKPGEYSIDGIPAGTEYGFLVRIAASSQ